MPTDLDIARSVSPRPIDEVATELGLDTARLLRFGDDKAKIRPDPGDAPTGRLVLVSAITPTPAGEGKTTVSVGLADGLRRIGVRAAVALREPSLGPTLGMKGGAAGGGLSQVIPMEDINLHFTGDLHAITAAHNLLAALIDNHLHHRGPLELEPRTVRWPRVLDVDDRALRHVVVGLGGKRDGIPRESGFDITAASEVMAVLCMARDQGDLRERLAALMVGRQRRTGKAITAADLDAPGAMSVLLRDAVLPNLVQTLEGTPALIHGGPFANIAQGTSSVIATRTALAHADVVVTEAGFGFDLGGEKFLDLKCPAGDVAPGCIVLVATVRALSAHGGPDNLLHHVEAASRAGVPVVVALNRFSDDTDADIDEIRAAVDGARFAVTEGFARGGAGAEVLAEAVREALAEGHTAQVPVFQDAGAPAVDNIERVCREVYGAAHVELTNEALRDWRAAETLGYDKLPVCIAKTPASLSDDPRRLGRPTGFTVTVREILISAGAGFLVPLTGTIMRMPGMPRVPASSRMDLDERGQVIGLD